MLTKDNSFRIMKIFFENPEKRFYIRELAKMTGLSPPGVMKIVKKLEKERLLVSKKGKVVKNVFAVDTEKFIQLKRFYNVISLFNSGLIDFLRGEYEEPEAIVLFGSYAEGSDTSKSDIDVAIVTKKRAKPDLTKFGKRLKRKISIYEIRTTECSKEFLNSLANGITLYGYLKVV